MRRTGHSPFGLLREKPLHADAKIDGGGIDLHLDGFHGTQAPAAGHSLISIEADGRQAFSVDGAEWGSWAGLSFRTSPNLRLNAVQLTFNTGATGVAQEQEIDVDNVVVRSGTR